MGLKFGYEDKIRVANLITKNLYSILDKKHISTSENKIKDYIEYLCKNTKFSRYRVKKLLSYDVVKMITCDDIDILSNLLNVDPVEFFKGDKR